MCVKDAGRGILSSCLYEGEMPDGQVFSSGKAGFRRRADAAAVYLYRFIMGSGT